MRRLTRFSALLLLCCLCWAGGAIFAQDTNADVVAEVKKLASADYTIPSWDVVSLLVYDAEKNPTGTDFVVPLKEAIEQLQPKEMPYSIVMCINGDPKTRMGFNWFTNGGIKQGVVQIVEGKDFTVGTPTVFPATSADAELAYWTSMDANGVYNPHKYQYTSHKAEAKDLKPNTLYSYRVGFEEGGKEYWSEIGSFTTAPEDKDGTFSFIYYTDPQAMNDEYFSVSARTTHKAQEMFPEAAFWMNAGDLVESYTKSEWEYEQFFSTQQDIWLHKPTAFVIGNHDVGDFGKNFTHHFNYGNTNFDNLQSMPGSVYSFVWGDVLFLAFQVEDLASWKQDAAGNWLIEYNEPYKKALEEWIRAELEAHPNVRWRIPIYHRPVYTGSSHQDDADAQLIRNLLAPIFDEFNIDLALQGHDHCYNVIGPVKDKQMVKDAVKSIEPLPLANLPAWTKGTPEDWNMTQQWKGTYDVTEGTLYFLNNSAGKKKYWPRGKEGVHNNFSSKKFMLDELQSGVTDYWSLFAEGGRFGQRGLPTFSHITVSPEKIVVVTYEVHDDGTSELFDEFTIVKDAPISSVAVESIELDATLELEVNKSIQLTATVKPDDATNKALTWTSSDELIATVDSEGNVTAVKAGVVDITVTAQDGSNVSATCKITVKDASSTPTPVTPVAVESVALDKLTLTLEEGKNAKLTATVKPDNADDKSVTWKTSNDKVAKVDNKGTVTAVKAGTATITVTTSNGKTATCKVTVKAKVSATKPTPVESTVLAQVQVVPNPFSHYIELRGVEKATEYIVYNLQGVMVLQGILSGESAVTVNTQQLPMGMYMVVLRAEDGTAFFRMLKR